MPSKVLWIKLMLSSSKLNSIAQVLCLGWLFGTNTADQTSQSQGVTLKQAICQSYCPIRSSPSQDSTLTLRQIIRQNRVWTNLGCKAYVSAGYVDDCFKDATSDLLPTQ